MKIMATPSISFYDLQDIRKGGPEATDWERTISFSGGRVQKSIYLRDEHTCDKVNRHIGTRSLPFLVQVAKHERHPKTLRSIMVVPKDSETAGTFQGTQKSLGFIVIFDFLESHGFEMLQECFWNTKRCTLWLRTTDTNRGRDRDREGEFGQQHDVKDGKKLGVGHTLGKFVMMTLGRNLHCKNTSRIFPSLALGSNS